MEVGPAPICAAPRHDYLERENMQLPSLNPQHALEHMRTAAPRTCALTRASHARALF